MPTEVLSIDVSFDQLRSLGTDSRLQSIFEVLYAAWVGGHHDRAYSIRIGELDVFFDDHGFLHLDFTTRFALPDHSEGIARAVQRELEVEDLRLTVDPPTPDITVAPAADPPPTGIIIATEMPDQERTHTEQLEKIILDPNDPEPEVEVDLRRSREIDLADAYKQERRGVRSAEREGSTIIPVLEFLNGRCWDNAALNVVHGLRPSAILVSMPGDPPPFEGLPWRVIVHLATDGRTIRHLEQEVVVALTGCRSGTDVACYVRGVEPPPVLPRIERIHSLLNPSAIRRLAQRR